MHITRPTDRTPRPGPVAWFTGEVRHDTLVEPPAPARVRAAAVTFQPGARTNWHTHPLGQTLIVTEGTGWVQLDSGARQEIGPGCVVWIEPGARHWHGATATTAMTHIAVQEAEDGRAVDWAEPVSDADYAG